MKVDNQKNLKWVLIFSSTHEIDMMHPTATVVAVPKKFHDYAETTDILMFDPYLVSTRPIAMVAEYVDMARKAIGDKKPVWAVLQAFGYQNEKNRGGLET